MPPASYDARYPLWFKRFSGSTVLTAFALTPAILVASGTPALSSKAVEAGADLALKTAQALWAMPFDAIRGQYAAAAQAGLVQRSMLASGVFERSCKHLEMFALGPLARRA